MKIQVGKTYKDLSDREWLIEVKLVHPYNSKFPYLGSTKDSTLCCFTEDGLAVNQVDSYNLKPNVVTKTGCIVICNKTTKYLYDTVAEALAVWKNCPEPTWLDYKEITYTEEE